MRLVLLDFESASGADLPTVGAARYWQDPTTTVLCLCWQELGIPGVAVWTPGEPTDALAALANNPDVMFIAHNASFERFAWEYVMTPDYGLAPVPVERWIDTMAMAARLALPLKLDTVLDVLRLPVQKDKEGSALVRKVAKPRGRGRHVSVTSEEQDRIVQYCRSDVEAEVALFNTLNGHRDAGERAVWLLNQKVNDRGVRLDVPLIHAAQNLIDLALVPRIARFRELTSGLDLTQRGRVQEWCHANGARLPNLQKGTLDKVLGVSAIDMQDEEDAEDEDRPDLQEIADTMPGHVREALEIRRIAASTSITKYAAMLATVGPDWRSRHLTQYHAASTGREAGRLWQPQNLPRPLFKAPVETLVAAVMSEDPGFAEDLTGHDAIETAITTIRHAIVPAPGKLLVVGDFAQVEARLVLALAGQWDKVKLLAEGRDVYLDMAQTIFDRPIDKDKDPEERQIGKNTVLGCGFQMGDKTFRNRYARHKPLEFATKVIQAYRRDWAPCVPDLWRGLEAAALEAVWGQTTTEAYGIEFALEDHWATVRLPSGRRLWYPFAKPTTRAMPWDPEDVRRSWSFGTTKNGQWISVDAYGGMLTENVVQAIARDLLVHAVRGAERAGLPVVLTIHDEIVCEVDEAKADPHVLREIMADVPAWAREMRAPIVAECWAGDRYRKG